MGLDPQMAKDVVELIGTATSALKKAEAELAELRPFKATILNGLPKAAEELVRYQRTPMAKEAAIERMKDPAVLVEVLAKAANPNLIAGRPPVVGTPEMKEKPAAEKKSAFEQLYSSQRTNAPDDGDAIWERALGTRR